MKTLTLKHLFLAVCILFNPLTYLIGQELCRTPIDNKSQIEYQSKIEKTRKNNSIVALATQSIMINVICHIENSATTATATSAMINYLNSVYNPHSIFFVKLCDNFYQAGATLSNLEVPYAINIFIFSNLSGAYAKGIGSNAFYIDIYDMTTTTAPHEMGHCLNLFHTHNELGCQELINGSNCQQCGDYICDTPADPKLYNAKYLVDSNCAYIGTVTQDGIPYNPDTRNYMSYSLNSCRNRFSPQQAERMYNSLLTLSALTPVRTLPQVQGPKVVCTSATFTQTMAPNNSIITWSVAPSNLVTQSSGSGSTASFSKVSNGDAVITFKNGCYNLQSYSFRLGPYSSSNYQISGPSSAQCNSYAYYSIPSLPGATSINWVWPSGWVYVSGQNTSNLTLRPKSSGVVSVGVNNGCGQSGSYATKFTAVYGYCGYSALTIYPNPTSNEVTVSFIGEATSLIATDEVLLESEYELKLVDKNQKVFFEGISRNAVFKIPTDGFPSGIYLLNISSKEGIIQRQLMIK